MAYAHGDTTSQPLSTAYNNDVPSHDSPLDSDDISKKESLDQDNHDLHRTPTIGEGDFSDDNYTKIGRYRTALIFITNQVGIGVLSLARAMQVLGLIPGIIAIIGMGTLATYTAYILVQFYRKYPQINNIVDCARIMGGKWLEAFVGFCFVLNLALTCASANVTMSIAFNTITNGAVCTVGFIGIPMLVCWILCMPRTMNFMAWMGIPCTISILSAVLIVMISLGVSGPNTSQPGGLGEPPNEELFLTLWGEQNFMDSFNSILNIAFAYGGNQAFVTVMAEMRDPSKDFTPAVMILQWFGVPLYVLVGAIIYWLAGQYTRSPALGSAAQLPRDISYGILLITLFGTGMVFGHTAIKYCYVVFMKKVLKSPHRLMDSNFQTWTVWLGCGTAFWITAFILANAIPLFDSILSISSALFVSWFTYGMAAAMWIFINWGNQLSTWRKMSLAALNWSLILMSCFFTGAGMWTAVQGMINIFNDPAQDIASPFTCADNSLF